MLDILIVDDEADIRDLIGDILRDEGFSTLSASDADGALGEIEAAAPALIVLDIWLQGSRMDGIEILKAVKRNNPDIPVVIISGHGNIEIAVAAIKQGAYDFVEKPFNTDQFLVVVERALEAHRLRRENAELRARETSDAELIGASPAIAHLRLTIDKVARTGSRVLFSGPPGSGKEVAARYLHALSPRAGMPFVVVNAASIDADKVEQVLFGQTHEQRAPEPGLLEKAHGGTLFLDEVADMPLGAQSKILRVLIDQTFTRRGGGETVRVDVRVVSATCRDLMTEIAEGRFRQDLYHRLNVVPVEIPPLAARLDDIPLLARHFVERLNLEQGLPARELSDEVVAELQTYEWPGNVRQLRNLIERLLIMGGRQDAATIGLDDLPTDLAVATEATHGSVGGNLASLPLRQAREVFERDYLVAQINRFGGNISRTANFVGMERSALHRKLKMLGVVTTSRGGARIAVTAEEDA